MTYLPLAVVVTEALASIARLDEYVLAQLIGTYLLAGDGLFLLTLPLERPKPRSPWTPGRYRPRKGDPDLNAWAAAIHHHWHVTEPAPVTKLPAPGGPRRREAA